MELINHTELEKSLSGINYPVDKEQLVEEARKGGAAGEILDALDGLPAMEYGSPSDVRNFLGAHDDVHDHVDELDNEDLISPDVASDLEAGVVDQMATEPVAREEFAQLGDEEDHEPV